VPDAPDALLALAARLKMHADVLSDGNTRRNLVAEDCDAAAIALLAARDERDRLRKEIADHAEWARQFAADPEHGALVALTAKNVALMEARDAALQRAEAAVEILRPHVEFVGRMCACQGCRAYAVLVPAVEASAARPAGGDRG
jgi:hypothetical protein